MNSNDDRTWFDRAGNFHSSQMVVTERFTLLGEKTWYIPRWLDRILPNITIEPPHDGEAPAPIAVVQPEPREA